LQKQGNGDILSYEDYQKNVENTSLSGAMIARLIRSFSLFFFFP